MSKLRIAVLASGGGTNLQAIIESCAKGEINAEIAVVVSDKPTVGALLRAKNAGIEQQTLLTAGFLSRTDYDIALTDLLKSYRVELVVLAGYMRLVSPVILNAFPDRVINIHPALLPSFPGLHAQRQALEYGVKISGCTVHFVDSGMDTGPIIAQTTVPVLGSDTEETLSERILVEEHKLYSYVISKLAAGKIRLENRKVIFK